MIVNKKMPFQYKDLKTFNSGLVEWVGDVFYDILPEKDYEVRDEQIFTAFQIADGFAQKKIHLAEAGLGTGKTFAYLMSAIPYARMTGKPVVIACATTALQEQLAGDTGDIQTLSKLLDLDVDARMAKSPHQYICDLKADEYKDELEEHSDYVMEWLGKTTVGERSEVPMLEDEVWSKIKWEPSLNCDLCAARGYCRLVKSKQYYSQARDLIVVDHRTFFQDLWTRQECKDRGQSTILPDYSAVVFDEGHRILLPAAMESGFGVARDEMDEMVSMLCDLQGARESLHIVTEQIETLLEEFFTNIEERLVRDDTSERQAVNVDEQLLKTALGLKKALDNLLVEMQIEQELYTESLESHQIQAFEGRLEFVTAALSLLCKNNGKESLVWFEEDNCTFWIVPRHVNTLLNKFLWSKELPVVLTSATLSNDGDFSYFKRSMGIDNMTSSTIGSPFDLENQITIEKYIGENRIEKLVECIVENKGRSLILLNSKEEMAKLKKQLKNYTFDFEIMFEDEAERGYLIRKFRQETDTVLVGTHFWEGIDIPGDALTMVVIWELPFALHDPVQEVKRQDAAAENLDPKVIVDYPEMALKLKQGCGRLIRKEDDCGKIVLFVPIDGMPWEEHIIKALPKGVELKTLK
ncbi:MAG: ATP-dependent DNA helicase [Cellulosilyticaceae bacterium]